MGRRGELFILQSKHRLAPAGAPGHLLSPEALPGLLSGLLGEGKAGLPGGGRAGLPPIGAETQLRLQSTAPDVASLHLARPEKCQPSRVAPGHW